MDRHVTIDERLAKVPLFAGLDKKELRQVSKLVTKLEVPAGRVLMRQGDLGHEFVIILEGEAEVTVDGTVVATRHEGDYVGEIALLADVPRTATVVAKTPMLIEVVEQRDFHSLLDTTPSIAVKMLNVLGSRLSETIDAARR